MALDSKSTSEPSAQQTMTFLTPCDAATPTSSLNPSISPEAMEPLHQDPFTDLFTRQYGIMFRLAHLLGSDDPENVAQEAFVRVHSRWAKLRSQEAAVAYLRTVVVNLVRTTRKRTSLSRLRPSGQTNSDIESAETTAIRRSQDSLIFDALMTLSARQRQALVLRYWLDLSEKQIAQAMGTSVGTAKSHVSRGLSTLRSILTTSEGTRDE